MMKDGIGWRILIVRLSAIGDCIETLPLVVALKSACPNSELTWVVDCGVDQLLRSHSCVDRVIRCKKGFLKRPKELFDLRRTLRQKRFDLALDPQGLLKSSLVAWLSGARRRIGFDQSQAREKAWWFYTDRVTATRSHLVERHLQLLEPLGIEATSPNFGMTIPEEATSWCDSYMSSQTLMASDFVVINPGAGWASRRWPPERFGIVAKSLWARYRLRSVIVWSGSEERLMAERIQRECPESLIAPSTQLFQLAALLSKCCFMLTSDTGPMHLAAAISVPCVALFSVTKPEHCGPYGRIHQVVTATSQAEEMLERKRDDDELIRRITVGQVLDACFQMLQSRSKQTDNHGQLGKTA